MVHTEPPGHKWLKIPAKRKEFILVSPYFGYEPSIRVRKI